MKKLLVFILCCCCLALSACSGFGADINGSISPPKPSGELYDIQKALEAYVDGRLQLVYPSSGDYRSAFVTEDITNDGTLDAFAFYSTKTDDNTTVMHINYIKQIESEWVSVSDLEVAASGVESIEFAKLDDSSLPKILVNWSRFSSKDKQLSVYSIESGFLSEVVSASFSAHSTCDFDGNGIKEIIAVYTDAETKVVSANLLSLSNNALELKSTCFADSLVTAYHTPEITTLKNGTPAVFIDAEKSTGMVTEVFYVEKGKLVSAFAEPVTGENLKTLRATQVKCQDHDGDGALDIPLATKLPSIPGMAETDSVYMTSWNSFDGKKLAPFSYEVINYSDGYYLELPDSWVSNFTVQRDVAGKERIMYRWNNEMNNTGEEILRIKAVSVDEWNDNSAELAEYSEITRNNEFVFAVKLSNSELTPDMSVLKENFSVLSRADMY